MTASKSRGTKWETAIVGYLKSRGFSHVERRALHGARDKGDIAGIPGVVIEAKNQNRHSLAEWIDEAQEEGANAAAALSVVWMHRRGKSSAGDGYVLMTGTQFTDLLARWTDDGR